MPERACFPWEAKRKAIISGLALFGHNPICVLRRAYYRLALGSSCTLCLKRLVHHGQHAALATWCTMSHHLRQVAPLGALTCAAPCLMRTSHPTSRGKTRMPPRSEGAFLREFWGLRTLLWIRPSRLSRATLPRKASNQCPTLCNENSNSHRV